MTSSRLHSDKHKTSLLTSGEKIALRLFTLADITPQYLSWLNDPEVTRFSNQRFQVHTKESSENYLKLFEGTSNMFLLMEDKISGEAIGTMTGYIVEHHGTADMGILLGNRSYWGKGIGLDAWSTLMNYLLNKNNLRKVTGGTVKSNQAMVRIMEKSGMMLEGVRLKQIVYDNREEDIVLYGKFRS